MPSTNHMLRCALLILFMAAGCSSGDKVLYEEDAGPDGDADGDSDADPCADALLWDGEYIVRNSADLTALSGYGRVNGNLFIEDTDLTNLDGLECLEVIDGHLAIFLNDSLTNVDGLSRLREVGAQININNNPELVDLEGLSAVTGSTGTVSLHHNGSLESLEGLRSLTSAMVLMIESNDSLTRVGMGGLESAGQLEIHSNSTLVELGLSSLTQVESHFGVTGNVMLPTCEAENLLRQLDEAPGDGVNIEGNDDGGSCE